LWRIKHSLVLVKTGDFVAYSLTPLDLLQDERKIRKAHFPISVGVDVILAQK